MVLVIAGGGELVGVQAARAAARPVQLPARPRGQSVRCHQEGRLLEGGVRQRAHLHVICFAILSTHMIML